ncbi:MAG TPA: Ig-like domain-containing protein [Gemmatimonadales bacterium]|nr:Ig-like domain-containing protein [Gemmatimonadales bacterium]
MSLRAAVLVGALVLSVPSPGATQGSQPLRKTDVIRLLSNPLISKSEVADLIRRNCVAFRPTPRDWADLRDFGADAGVLSSLGGCTGSTAAPRPAPAPPPAAPLAAVLLPPRVNAVVGTTALARVQIKRGDLPQAGVPLVLRGSAAISGGSGQDAQATTDPGGIAAFQVPVGRVPATYQLQVVTGSGATIAGTPPLELAVGAAAPAALDVQPARVEVHVGERGAVPVQVTLRDSLGNAVAGEPVTLQADGPDLGLAAATRVTDSVGHAAFSVERAGVRRGGRLLIRVRGQSLGGVDVIRTDALAVAASGFVAGTGQRGIARTSLNDPVVFQIRNSAGRPIAGKTVAFRAVNAEVSLDSVVTDSAGIARVDITLGKQAGPALLTATVDSVQKQTAFLVEPAAPVSVVIERDGMRVDGSTMAVPANAAFVIRVSAQDAYGNAVGTADLARMIQKMRSRYNQQSQLLKMIGVESDGAAALVTFKPTGVGQADLSIAGATVSVNVVSGR